MTKAKAIRSGTSAKAALRSLGAQGAQDFARQLARVMASDDIEGAHKARVALRRLGATFRAFRPILRKGFYRKHSARLRKHARTIGLLRDADVLAHDFPRPDLIAAAADLRHQTRHLLTQSKAARWTGRLPCALAGSAWYLSGKSAKAARRSAVTPLAVKALDRIWRECLSPGPDLTLLTEDARHDLRKSLKILRYLCDQFAPIWPGPASEPFLVLLGGLQDDLGRLNDLVLARARGLVLPDDPQTLAHAQILWSSLQSTPIFWDAPPSRGSVEHFP